MNTHADKTQVNKSKSAANLSSQTPQSGQTKSPFVDKRPETVAQRKRQTLANNSSRIKQLKAHATPSSVLPIQRMEREGAAPADAASGAGAAPAPPAPAAAAPAIATYEQYVAAREGMNGGQARELAIQHPGFARQMEELNRQALAAQERQERAVRDRQAAAYRQRVERAHGPPGRFRDETHAGDNRYHHWTHIEAGGRLRVHVGHNGRGGIAFASAGEHGEGRHHITQPHLIDHFRREIFGAPAPRGGRADRGRSPERRPPRRRRSRSRSPRGGAGDRRDGGYGRRYDRRRSPSPPPRRGYGGAGGRAASPPRRGYGDGRDRRGDPGYERRDWSRSPPGRRDHRGGGGRY